MNKSTNKALRQKTLEAIHDSAVDAIITISENGDIETVNPATEKLFGYCSDEMLGKNVKMLMPMPFRMEHDGYIGNYLKTRIAKIIGIGREVIGQKKDGSVFPMHLAVSEVQVDRHRVFAGFIRDLSGLKHVEEQQISLGRIIEDSLNEVYIFNTQSLQFIQVNRGARENLGYSLDELQRLTPVDIKPEFTPEHFRTLIRPLELGSVERIEFSTLHERKNGTTYNVDVNLQMSTYLAQTAFVAIALDVSERCKAENLVRQQQETMKADLERLVERRTVQLEKTQAELVRSEKFSTLGKVSGGIAHEIRNPLNAVKTSAYFLLNAKNPAPEKIREHLERIDRQVSLIDNVITALSDVAKLPEANLQPLAIEALLRTVIKGIDLPPTVECKFEFPDLLPLVMVDEHQISIAFRNLIRNAREAMPEGGTITIAAEVRDHLVSYSIADTGTGIAIHNLEKIFEPLFTTKARGMGLGLSIALAIVEKNCGTLSLESKLGHGAKFSVALLRGT